MPNNLNKIIEENELLFDSQFPNLNCSNKEGGYDARTYAKEFNRKASLRLIEGFREMVKGLKTYIDIDPGIIGNPYSEKASIIPTRKIDDILSELGNINEIK